MVELTRDDWVGLKSALEAENKSLIMHLEVNNAALEVVQEKIDANTKGSKKN